MPLPDIPLPKLGGLFKKKPSSSQQQQIPSGSGSPIDPMLTGGSSYLYTPGSLSPDRTGDRTDDEMLRYEASSIEGDATHR